MKRRKERRKKESLSDMILSAWIQLCVHKNKRSFSRRSEHEISSLYPGVDAAGLVREHYRKRISLSLWILAAGVAFCILYFLADSDGLLYGEKYLKRTPAGEEKQVVELDAQIGDVTLSGVEILLEERDMDNKEAEELLDGIAAQLPEIILGENTGPDHVDQPLTLPASWEDAPVSIFWESSDPEYLKEDGTFGDGKIPQSGQKVTLTAELSYGEVSKEVSFPITLYAPELTRKEQMQKDLTRLIEQEEEGSRTEEYFELPSQLEGEQIRWKEPSKSILPVLLVLAAVVAVFAGQEKDLHKQYEERNKQLLLEYPEFVSRLQLLICSGMSIHSAFFKIGKEYQRNLKKGGKKKYVNEELLLVLRKMENGMSEAEALNYFGRRCHIFCYKKLVSLIQQNLKRGADGLRDALMNETRAAFEERKQTARRSGEEAGTKLLFPMMLMMGIVMVIIMIPAYFSFGGLGT